MMRVGALECALCKFQPVEGGREKAQCCNDSEADVCPISSKEDEKLTDEIAETWKSERSHGKDEARSAQHRHGLPQAAHMRDVASMQSFLKEPGKDEECAGTDAVADHLDDGAFQRDFVSGEDSEKHESHVTDAGVGDEAFEIRLSNSQHCAVENSDDADCHHEGSEFTRWAGKERQYEADQPVRACLQQKSRQDDAASGGSFGVSVREPG